MPVFFIQDSVESEHESFQPPFVTKFPQTNQKTPKAVAAVRENGFCCRNPELCLDWHSNLRDVISAVLAPIGRPFQINGTE